MKNQKRRKTYESDLTDQEWQIIEPLLPKSKEGKPRNIDIREVINAINYLLKSGCSWRLLPHDFPQWQLVYYYFRFWKKKGYWKEIHDQLRGKVRIAAGKKIEPTAGIIDSQSVKTVKRGDLVAMMVDTLGLILCVVVHGADVQDRDGAKLVFEKMKDCFTRLELIWADGGYAGKLIDYVNSLYSWVLEIVKRTDDLKGFHVLPKRWIVERTFGWFGNYRRLSKDYEYNPETSENMIYIAMNNLMVRRLARISY